MSLLAIPFALISPLFALCLAILGFARERTPFVSAAAVALAMAVPVFFIESYPDTDIARHMALLSNYASVPIWECFDAGHYSGLYVWDLACWAIARLGSPYYLQAIAAFVGYLIMFYIVFDSSKDRALDTSEILFAALIAFSIVPMASIFIGIRSAMACLIAALGFYFSFFKRKQPILCFVLMIVAVLVHHMAVFAMVIWLLVPVARNNPRMSFLVMFLATVAIGLFSSYLLPIIGNGNVVTSILSDVLNSALGYSSGDQWMATQASSLNTRVNVLANLLVVLLLTMRFRPLRKLKSASGDDPLSDAMICFTLFAVATFGLQIALQVNGTRYMPIIGLLAAALWSAYRGGVEGRKSKSAFAQNSILVLLLLALAILHVYSLLYGVTNGFMYACSFASPLLCLL